MVMKRSRQAGVCLGALVLLAGSAQAAQQGYWSRQGDVEHWNKKLPPHGPVNLSVVSGSATHTLTTGLDTCKVRFISNILVVGKVITHTVTDFTWAPLPVVMIPAQVVPVAGTVRIAEATGTPDSRQGTLYCQITASSKDPELFNLFAGLNNGVRAKTVAYSEFANTKNSVGKGAKGQRIYLVYTASLGHGESFKVATPYVWVEGVPPASPPPTPLPPSVVPPGSTPTPTPPVAPTPVGGSLEGTWKINQNNYTGVIEFSRTAAGWTGRIYFDVFRKWEPLGSITFNESNGQVAFTRTDHNQRHVGTLRNSKIEGQFESAGVTYRWDAIR